MPGVEARRGDKRYVRGRPMTLANDPAQAARPNAVAGDAFTARRALPLRAAIGLAQGFILYILSTLRADSPAFGVSAEVWPHALSMARTVAVFAPLPLLFGLGRLPGPRLALWSAIAAATLAAVGWLAPAPVWSGAPPVITVWLFSLIVVYIVHEFVQGAFDDGRPIARYETYFDNAWRHGFQAALALAFVGAFWIVISLGAWLFNLIGLDFVKDIVFSDEFRWPASALAFALGLHLTDADSGLTRGARQIGLALLSWLAILMTLILTAFLAALPFTGLEPLWDTKRATVLLLNAAATMILLINAAYQVGEPPRSGLMRAVVRFSALPLAGIVALAAIGLFLRTGQYGLTPARVLASAELVIVAIYAAGYCAAALKPGPWLALVRPVNIAGAAATAAILLALMTPLADPARLAVANQLARLDSGKVDPDDFDFGFLADARSSHWGKSALTKLAQRSGDERSDRIALLARNPGERRPYLSVEQTFNDRRDSLVLVGEGVIPDAALLPTAGDDPIGDCVAARRSALEADTLEAEAARRRQRMDRSSTRAAAGEPGRAGDVRCPARLVDLDADGDLDLLIWRGAAGFSGEEAWPDASGFIWLDYDDQEGHRALGPTRLKLAVILQNGPENWTPAGFHDWRGATRPAAAARPDNRDAATRAESHARLMRLFAEAAPVPPLWSDLAFGEHYYGRLQTLAPPPSPDSLQAAFAPLDQRPPPLEAFIVHPASDIAGMCASIKAAGAAPLCFSRFVDLNEDGVEEAALLSIHPNARGGTVEALQLVDGEWRLAARATLVGPRPALKAEATPEATPAELRAFAGSMAVAPPLMYDLMVGGERHVFEATAPPQRE